MSDNVVIQAGTRERVALEMTRDVMSKTKFQDGDDYRAKYQQTYTEMLMLVCGASVEVAIKKRPAAPINVQTSR